jgi:hypothetical protein
VLRVWVDATQIINKTEHDRHDVQGTVGLKGGQPYDVKVEYFHHHGAASNHLWWSAPGFQKRILLLNASAD